MPSLLFPSLPRSLFSLFSHCLLILNTTLLFTLHAVTLFHVRLILPVLRAPPSSPSYPKCSSVSSLLNQIHLYNLHDVVWVKQRGSHIQNYVSRLLSPSLLFFLPCGPFCFFTRCFLITFTVYSYRPCSEVIGHFQGTTIFFFCSFITI